MVERGWGSGRLRALAPEDVRSEFPTDDPVDVLVLHVLAGRLVAKLGNREFALSANETLLGEATGAPIGPLRLSPLSVPDAAEARAALVTLRRRNP